MSASYKIAISDDKASTYKWVTTLIAALNFFGFVLVSFGKAGQEREIIGIIGVAIALMLLAFIFWKGPKRHFIEIGFLIIAFTWAFCGLFFFALVLACFAAIGLLVNQPKVLIVDTQGVKMPVFPVRVYPWRQVAYIILKDDILTIETKQNQVMQFNLYRGSSPKEEDFNLFCKQMLLRIEIAPPGETSL